MSPTFNGQPIFEPGVYRFSQGAIGEHMLLRARVDPFQAGSTPIGPLELTIIVRGRLIAPSESELWLARDELASHLADPPTTAELVEPSGRAWADMSFISFTPADRTDRGRMHSLAYTAIFTRLIA